jgi:hypothetical protein
MSGLATCPYMPDKEVVMVKAEKGDLLHGLERAMGRGRVSTQSIFSHLWGTEMSFSRGQKYVHS